MDHISGLLKNKASWVIAGFLAVALFLLVTEHRAHFYGALPYLFLLACPFMHFFMHHGGRKHGSEGRADHTDDKGRRS